MTTNNNYYLQLPVTATSAEVVQAIKTYATEVHQRANDLILNARWSDLELDELATNVQHLIDTQLHVARLWPTSPSVQHNPLTSHLTNKPSYQIMKAISHLDGMVNMLDYSELVDEDMVEKIYHLTWRILEASDNLYILDNNNDISF
jgi:hypothetical protein